MANYRFSSDLIDDILHRGGENTDGSSDYEAKALEYLNRAYRVLWHGGGEFNPEMHEDWWWLKKDPPGVLVLPPVISDSVVTVTEGSATAVLSVAPASSVAGYHFKTDTHSDVFRVLAHTAGLSTLTLDTPYTGDSGVLAYRLMKLEHNLASDVLKVIAPMRVQAEARSFIDGTELSALERDWPITHVMNGTPEMFAHVNEQKIRMNRYGNNNGGNNIRVEYDYLRQPDDLTNSGSEEPAVPLAYRHVLADMALFYLYTDKNDDRASAMAQQAGRVLASMMQENRKRMMAYSRSLGHIFTRPSNRRFARNYPLRTSSGFIIG